MILATDELQAGIYSKELGTNMKQGAPITFSHGLNISFNLVKLRSDRDVLRRNAATTPAGRGSSPRRPGPR